ncbi:MAG: hypothetical protein D6729_15130 [Deltaproteobacteria bacterium]|nr:MAG: hypothetical protein D6729_15130 [Deltaproteobacteria bacterium]
MAKGRNERSIEPRRWQPAAGPLRLALLLLAALGSSEAGARRLTEADLRPYLAGTPYEAAAEALREGRRDAARAAFDAATGAKLDSGVLRAAREVLLARLLEAEGTPAEASRHWEAAAESDEVASGPLLARAVDAALRAGEVARAWALVEAMPPGEARGAAARGVAEAWLLRGDLPEAEARTLLEAIEPADAAGLALVARLREHLGDVAGAKAARRRLYLEYPESAEAKAVAASLAGERFTLEERAGRIERLLRAHENEAVIREVGALRLDGTRFGPVACRLRFAWGKAARKARHYRLAIEVLSEVAARCRAPGIRVKALYLWASAESILRGDPAIPIYLELARDFPAHPYADDALFFVADLHQDGGRLAKARRVLARQVRRYPRGDYAGEAMWRLFWMDRQRRPKRALRALERLVAAFEGRGGEDLERGLYWLGRLRARMGDVRGAAEAYGRVVRDFPLSYHALLALPRWRRLDAAGAERFLSELEAPPAVSPPFDVEVGEALAAHPALARGLHLLRLELLPEAADAFDAAARDARGEQDLLALALLLDRAGDAHRGHWIVRRRIGAFRRAWPAGAGWRLWRAGFPLAYRDLVERAARTEGLPPNLLQALIREESALQPQVVSWAGATGLAQLMPATARDLAGRIGYAGPVTRETLKDPALNLRLAARYHRDLHRLFHGNHAVAIAAYNAGERTVGRWYLARKDWDLDVFVEEIGIAETRRYTKRVLRSFATYEYLYGPPDAAGRPRILELPEKVGGSAAPQGARASARGEADSGGGGADE